MPRSKKSTKTTSRVLKSGRESKVHAIRRPQSADKQPLNEDLVISLRASFKKLATTSAIITERRMFGGVCFCVNGNMVGGVNGNDLMMKCDKDVNIEDVASSIGFPVQDMMFTGRKLRGFYQITPNSSFDNIIDVCAKYSFDHVVKLPPKKK